MIRDQNVAFLGAVVQPKTKAPVWVVRKAHTFRTVVILARDAHRLLSDIGDGYLDGGNMGEEYLRAVKITGFPRSHTPDGVKGRFQGMGYGTCLYTGLVLLAQAIAEDEIDPGVRLPGKGGRGICSDDESRSSDASEWWGAAHRRGLTQQEDGEVETTTTREEMEDEDLTDYMTSRGRARIDEAIRDAVADGSEWYPTSITVRGDLEREVESEGGSLTADYYTFTSAAKHKLVVLTDTFDGHAFQWAKSAELNGMYDKDVILALNVSNEDPLFVGKLALCAKHAGATDAEVIGMIARNRFGIDLLEQAIGRASPESMRMGTRTPFDAGGVMLANPRRGRRSVPRDEDPPPPAKRNPPPEPSRAERRELDRAIDELERRRDDLGWNDLESLP